VLGRLARRIRREAQRLRARILGPEVGREEGGVHRTVRISPGATCVINPTAFIAEGVLIRPGAGPVSIGPHAQIGPYSVIFPGKCGVTIGANVMVGPHVVLAGGNHDFRRTDVPLRFAGDFSKGPIVIEDGAWIGANVCVLDGVRVGCGAVIGAGAVVTKDIPAYAMAWGVPAVVRRSRREL
jgi:acetyltransferase-like isoleucine patch superfamily enzyme